MKDVQNYLYHGLTNSKDLEKILCSGYIMTRDSLNHYLSPSEFKRFEEKHSQNWNGRNAVSIACHPKNVELIKKYNITLPSPVFKDEDNAYREYILPNLTLILNPTLLEDFERKENSLKMGYEIQILGDIPIDYIKAIGIRTNKFINTFSTKKIYQLQAVLNELENSNKGKNFVKYYDSTTKLREDFENYTLEQIYNKSIYTNYIPNLIELLKKYNLNIPIVDLEYGYLLPSQEIQKKRIKRLKKQYNNYINRKYKNS